MVDWKKEIKFGDIVGRKGDGASALAEDDAPMHSMDAPPEAAKTPIWKREIRVRKPKEEGGRPPRRSFASFAGPKSPESEITSETSEPKKSRFASFARPKSPEAEIPGETSELTQKSSRFARPTPPDSDLGAETAETRKKSSRFARSSKDAAEKAEPKPSRFARKGKDADTTGERRKKPSRFARPSASDTESPPAKKPSRFARAGAAKPDSATRSRGRSPLTREISFRRKPKADPQAVADSPKAPKRGRKKKAEIVGLKVGASHIAAAQVITNGQVELVQVAREPIERGVVVGGELRNPDALGVALKEFFRRHKLPATAVRLGIGTNRIGVRRLEIGGLQDPSHLENAIRFRAQEVLPIPLEEAILDYQVVGESIDEKGQKTYRVLLVVAYRDLVERYVRACRAAGVKLVGVDLEAFALLRALGPTADHAPDDSAVVVVSVGHDRSTFVVADGATCEFARVLDWGGGALDVAIARALDLTPSQAEPIKRSLTLNVTQERLEGYTQEQAVAVYEAVRKELQNFVRELVSSLHFYQNQPGSLGIGEITITGGTAQLPGLAAELNRLIGVTVRVGDPFVRVQSGKRVDSHAEVGSLAVAVGLGIEG